MYNGDNVLTLLIENKVKNEGLKYLCELLKVNTNLTKLSVRGTYESVIAICNLDLLIENEVTLEGLKFLNEVLKVNSTLVHLDIGRKILIVL